MPSGYATNAESPIAIDASGNALLYQRPAAAFLNEFRPGRLGLNDISRIPERIPQRIPPIKVERTLKHHLEFTICAALSIGLLAAAEPAGRLNITLPELAKSLPPEPVTVVFDVDDTVLFTSPGFQWGTRVYGPDIVSAGVPVREQDLPTEESRRKYREFWTRMNNELDQYSVKKWIADELIKLHKSRGDRICFVTKRIYTSSEKLTDTLKATFDLPANTTVIFTNRESKVAAFRKVGAVISYGDSDGDIRESIQAGARPIRILRARNSVNHDPTNNGAFGEEVLLNSEFD
jgi:acid phosphatase (class B)